MSVSLCRIHLSLNNNKVYAFIVGLHALPNSSRILTAGLQAHISRRSVYTYISCDSAYRAGIYTHYVHENSLV